MSNGRYFLKQSDFLRVGEFLSSPSGKYHAIVETTGNFVLYRGKDPDNKKERLWESGAIAPTVHFRPISRESFYVVMQTSRGILRFLSRCAPSK